jgi:hypothetical protein
LCRAMNKPWVLQHLKQADADLGTMPQRRMPPGGNLVHVKDLNLFASLRSAQRLAANRLTAAFTLVFILALVSVLGGCATRGDGLHSKDTWPPRAVDTDPPGAAPAGDGEPERAELVYGPCPRCGSSVGGCIAISHYGDKQGKTADAWTGWMGDCPVCHAHLYSNDHLKEVLNDFMASFGSNSPVAIRWQVGWPPHPTN